MITRPVPKERLKKMFLKMLWEHKRPGGKYGAQSGYSWSIDTILADTLPFHFQLNNLDPNLLGKKWALTKEEMRNARLGVEELQRSGFICEDPEQDGRNVKDLTDKGRAVAENEPDDMVLASVDIEALLSNANLLDRVRDDYLNGNYDTAIKNAFQLVEEAVRAKAGQSPAVVGHDLMVNAFAPGRAVLTHPDAQAPAEHHALFFLFDGSNGWFRNPTHHRTVGYSDPQESYSAAR
jgi:uncharacterized protein (TIGR02391 family)